MHHAHINNYIAAWKFRSRQYSFQHQSQVFISSMPALFLQPTHIGWWITSINMMLLSRFSPPSLVLGLRDQDTLRAEEKYVSCSPSPTIYTHSKIVSKYTADRNCSRPRTKIPELGSYPSLHSLHTHTHTHQGARAWSATVRIWSGPGCDVTFSSLSNQLAWVSLMTTLGLTILIFTL